MYAAQMTIEDRIAELKENRLRFDCIKMDLVQSQNSNPVAFRGMGFIEQKPDGQLTFKIFVSVFENTDVMRHFNASMETSPGKLFAPEKYYDLTLVSVDGSIWTASNILPECSWSRHSTPIVTGKLRKIRTSEDIRKATKENLDVYFFEDLKLPIWPKREGGVAKFEAANCEFEVRESEQQILVSASSKDPLPQNLAVRIQEALKFFATKPAHIRAIGLYGPDGTIWELMSAAKSTIDTKLGAPIAPNSVEFLDNGWDLIRSYLEYVVKNSTADYWSYVTYHVHNATEASANSMDACAIGVSVAVEGLANLVQLPDGGGRSSLVKEFSDCMLPKIKENEKFSSLHDRLKGLLGMMNNPRVQDRLIPLAQSGRVTADYVKAWSALRNKHVHPKAKDLQKLADGDIQEFLDLIQKVTTLMYEIVFHLIDYKGPYVDFGSYGYPMKQYPQTPNVD